MSDNSLSNSDTAQAHNNKISNPFKSIVTLFAFLSWIVIMLLVMLFYKVFNAKNMSQFYLYFHRGACWIFSIKCNINGKVSTHQPTLFLSNHVSYLDIIILGAYIPGYFIAKSEVSGWPLLGFLAKLQNTLFFERKGNKVQSQLNVMAHHFNQHKNLILFPEGTSTNGEEVLPFKSSLLKSAELSSEDVMIQPVTICYNKYHNKKMNAYIRDHFAWYGEMPFGSHFFSAAGLGNSVVNIIFHQPVKLSSFTTRKDCAQHCCILVEDGLKECLAK